MDESFERLSSITKVGKNKLVGMEDRKVYDIK